MNLAAKTIFLKEIKEIIGNKLLLYTIIGPVLILPILPLAIAYTTTAFSDTDPITASDVAMFIKQVPQWADLPVADVFQIVMMQQMMVLFLIIPLIIPLTVAAFSIIGEKKAHTLEPLLATPTPTSTILLGKAIAAIMPGLFATWFAYAISIIGLKFMVTPVVFAALFSPTWWVAMLFLVPLLAILAVMIGIIISSRVNDTRVAQQLGGVVLLPVVALSIGQISGFLLLNLNVMLIATAAALVLDALALWMATVLFERERILTRWK